MPLVWLRNTYTNRDSEDPVVAVLLDCVKQSLLFRLKVCIVLRPDSDQKLGACPQGSRHSVCQSIAVRAGIKSDTLGIAWKAGELVESGLPLALRSAVTIDLGS